MKIILLRLFLVLSLGFIGLVIGTSIGAAFLVPPGQGLAAPFEALGYGFLAGLIALALGIVLCFLLKEKALTLISLSLMVIALLLVGRIIYNVRAEEEARKDPESAYAGIPNFTVSVEQIIITDPYLRVKMHVDSKARIWESKGPAPDYQLCRGRIAAQSLQEISDAFSKFTSLNDEKLGPCLASASQAEKRLTWSLDGSAPAQLDLSPACLSAVPEMNTLVLRVNQAAQRQKTKITCE